MAGPRDCDGVEVSVEDLETLWTAPVALVDKYRSEHHEIGRNIALAAPLVLVTVMAVFGQVGWFAGQLDTRGRLPIPTELAALICAVTVETISLFLAAEAHGRAMNGDQAGPVRVASYAMATFVGIVNYSHWRPGIIAVVFGVMSASGPALWAIRSRSLRRAELRRAGALTPPALRLGWLRWALYPRRSWTVFREAAWDGVTDPAKALAAPALVPVVLPAQINRHKAPKPIEGDRVAQLRTRLAAGETLSAGILAGEGRWGSRSTAAELLRQARESKA